MPSSIPPPGRAASGRPPTVTIGMPAFNGEPYVEEAIESVLAQSFEDLELVIADNHSTDRTYDIARAYAARDQRVRCIRHRENYGYINNFNTVFRLSSGRYFKWAACDDILAPDFLRRTVEVLERDASVALVYPDMPAIDERGVPVRVEHHAFDPDALERTASADPAERYSATMYNFWYTDHLYGLIRADALARTRLHARHFIGDHILLAELSLYGRFHHVCEPLLMLRRHTGQTSKAPSARRRLTVVGGPPPGVPPGLAIAWQYPRRLYFHASAVHRSPLAPATRARCYAGLARAMARWATVRVRRTVS